MAGVAAGAHRCLATRTSARTRLVERSERRSGQHDADDPRAGRRHPGGADGLHVQVLPIRSSLPFCSAPTARNRTARGPARTRRCASETAVRITGAPFAIAAKVLLMETGRSPPGRRASSQSGAFRRDDAAAGSYSPLGRLDSSKDRTRQSSISPAPASPLSDAPSPRLPVYLVIGALRPEKRSVSRSAASLKLPCGFSLQ